ncbi:hypothetical protein BGZ52_006412 [Haplosporangium bisporale]|nr:hypothetical protein BGZ52_006412 [Haplosporangium bisporale]
MTLTKTYADGSTPKIAIIGAGVTGICAAIQLQRQLQISTYTIFEFEAYIGGVWANNTYPGAGLDAPAYLYGYSFAPNYEWSKRYVSQSEVLEYVQSTAKTYNIYDKIRFNTRVTNMLWNESRKKWILHWVNSSSNEQGDTEVDVVLHGSGLLRIPKVPKKFESFQGDMWHSARWNHSVDLTGKRVGVVGTSASGVQIIPAIADKVESLDVYGRTPVYITPQSNGEYGRIWRFFCRYIPFFHALYIVLLYIFYDASILLYHKPAWNSILHRTMTYIMTWLHRFAQLPSNPTLRRKLTPKYELASRRIVLSNNYYPTFKRDNVSLHTDEIVSINGKTIETKDGSFRELDVLVLATGFNYTLNFPPGYWIGRDGIDIPANWHGNPTIYNGTFIPNAPNFYLLCGPTSIIAHIAVTRMIETQVMHVIRSLSYMMQKDLSTMEIRQEAAEEFIDEFDKRMDKMMFTTKVMPQFLNSLGKCRVFWCGSATEFWWHMRELHPERFLVQGRKEGAEKSYSHLNGARDSSAIEH